MTVDPAYTTLFQTLETHFQKTSFPEKWPILAITTLAASPDPNHAHNLYLYLTRSETPNTTPDTRKALIRRLREALLKTIPLIGVCKPIEAILSIAAVEQPEDRDYSFTREGWQCDEANHAHGVDWFEKLYKGNAGDTLGLFAAHRDFAWLSMEITYGLFLADRAVLDDLDTQLVVLPAIMSQDLRTETHWHIRGTRRLGVSMEEVRVVWDCVKLVAGFFGNSLDRVPTVDEVEPDV